MSPALFDDSAPLWRDAIVGASVAAMAAAAGLGAHYEVGTAPWQSILVGGVTALALWGAHRQLSGQRRAHTLKTPVRRQAGPMEAPAPSAPPVPSGPQAAAGGPRLNSVDGRMVPSSAQAPAGPTSLRRAPDSEATHQPARPGTDRDELSAFVPRQPPALTGAGPAIAASAVSSAPTVRAQSASAIDPEAQFLQLQSLVRQLAAEVPGPRAASPDPDRATHPVSERPRLQVGFAAQPSTSEPQHPAGPATPQPFVPPPSKAPQPSPIDSKSPIARLAEAVAAERFDVLLEPIQKLAEARPRHFEISVRFRDNTGVMLEPTDVKRIARNTGLAVSIDALKLPRVAKVVQRVQSRGGAPSDVLTTLEGASLADHSFFESLAATFPAGAPGALVLSFPQADVRAFARIHWAALTALADMGLRFALDDVSDLDMDFELMRARQFVFAKLDTSIFLGGLPCAGTIVPPRDICRHLETAGLELIVSGIDAEDDLARLTPHAIPFGQGKLFGGPRPVKADILR